MLKTIILLLYFLNYEVGSFLVSSLSALFSRKKALDCSCSIPLLSVCFIHEERATSSDDDDGPELDFSKAARDISNRLRIPLLSSYDSAESQGCTHALTIVPYRYCADEHVTYALGIESLSDELIRRKNKQQILKKKTNKKKSNPLFVDLCPPVHNGVRLRGQEESGTTDLLIKAVAPQKGSTRNGDDISGSTILDLTAGLGQDSLILAMNAATKHVTMVERNPIVAALLQDAMRRLELIAKEANPSTTASKGRQESANELLTKLSFIFGDGRAYLAEYHQQQQRQQECPPSGIDGNDRNVICDIIYLDPMFPTRSKSAAVKKGMAILHGLLQTQDKNNSGTMTAHEKEVEERELLLLALKSARLRVVVKRPIKALALGARGEGRMLQKDAQGPKPSYSIEGTINRWDVYVKPHVQVAAG